MSRRISSLKLSKSFLAWNALFICLWCILTLRIITMYTLVRYVMSSILPGKWEIHQKGVQIYSGTWILYIIFNTFRSKRVDSIEMKLSRCFFNSSRNFDHFIITISGKVGGKLTIKRSIFWITFWVFLRFTWYTTVNFIRVWYRGGTGILALHEEFIFGQVPKTSFKRAMKTYAWAHVSSHSVGFWCT